MTALLLLACSLAVLGLGGAFYSRFLARAWGEDPSRPTPATALNDGRDYVPTPAPVVFAHHYASIAGAGPIIGPVIAICYGWAPALLWILIGGVLIGATHDFLATFMATREGGQSIATVARRVLGNGPFVGLILFLLVALALVCATFLNLSAAALTSTVEYARLGLGQDQTLFRVVTRMGEPQVVIGGIASTSVIVITAVAPLIGWMYIRRQVPVWICSLISLGVCCASIAMGILLPVALSEGAVLGLLTGTDIWKLILAAYVLVAAGVPVWMFLQSRDFINVHILYAGLAGLVAALFVAGFRGAGAPAADALPAWDMASGGSALGAFWPAMFLTIACGAVSGFHSLCAGGTTCKQLKTERAVRHVGYWAMILESLLAVCVVTALVVGLSRADYLRDVHPKLAGLPFKSNPILGFAMAVGNTCRAAFGCPVAYGALAGMILLEGFLVTTLDTAIRLMRYLLEEVWHVIFGAATPAADTREDISGSSAVPAAIGLGEDSVGARSGAGARSPLGRFLGSYWVNSGLAVGLTLLFAFSSGIMSLWSLFATANQLLAAFVLLLGSLWLIRRGRGAWMTFIPALFMLATTVAGLIQLLVKFRPRAGTGGAAAGNVSLFIADLVLMGLTAYLLITGTREWAALRARTAANPAAGTPDREK